MAITIICMSISLYRYVCRLREAEGRGAAAVGQISGANQPIQGTRVYIYVNIYIYIYVYIYIYIYIYIHIYIIIIYVSLYMARGRIAEGRGAAVVSRLSDAHLFIQGTTYIYISI